MLEAAPAAALTRGARDRTHECVGNEIQYDGMRGIQCRVVSFRQSLVTAYVYVRKIPRYAIENSTEIYSR